MCLESSDQVVGDSGVVHNEHSTLRTSTEKPKAAHNQRLPPTSYSDHRGEKQEEYKKPEVTQHEIGAAIQNSNQHFLLLSAVLFSIYTWWSWVIVGRKQYLKTLYIEYTAGCYELYSWYLLVPSCSQVGILFITWRSLLKWHGSFSLPSMANMHLRILSIQMVVMNYWLCHVRKYYSVSPWKGKCDCILNTWNKPWNSSSWRFLFEAKSWIWMWLPWTCWYRNCEWW